jgi:hypothetical protein
MSNSILRPIFNDGQILSAADLVATVDYPREQLGRHERYLHSWGIAYGFDLKTTPKTDATTQKSYVEVTVAPGLAIDGRGREVVLNADQLLDPVDFSTAHVFDPAPASKDAWYPVYVRGLPPTKVTQTSLTGACSAANQATRETEDVQFIFKAPNPLSNSDAPYSTPGPGDPTDPPNSGQAWDILIGFVQWDGTSQFKDARAHNDAGITRRLAGVQADRIEARDGSLTLQSSDTPATKLMVVVKEKVGNIPGSMTFGGDDGHGGVTNLLQIDDSGNLSIKGKFQSGTSLPPGATSVQSGLATDGVILPLPAGVSETDFTGNKVALHIQVVPVVPDVSQSTDATSPFAAVPLLCHVDGDRRVHCVIRSLTTPGGPITTTDTPGTCRYTVIAARAVT